MAKLSTEMVEILRGTLLEHIIFPFSHATPYLGATIFTPVVGEWVLDAWFTVSENWDVATSNLHVGSAAAIDAGHDWFCGDPGGDIADLNDSGVLDVALEDRVVGGNESATMSLLGRSSDQGQRIAPFKLNTTDPIICRVQLEGSGDDPAATEGQGEVHILVLHDPGA